MKHIFKYAMLDCRDILIGTFASLGILEFLGHYSIGPF